MLKPRTVIVGVFIGLILPLWFFAAWAVGLIPIGRELPMTNETPVMAEITRASPDQLVRCLAKDHSGRLSLVRAGSPHRPERTRRLRNRSLHLIVDVSPRGTGSEVRVYKLSNSPLDMAHRIAIQTCVPEYALPHPGDPRNSNYYRAMLARDPLR
jgi:hypothetical protein